MHTDALNLTTRTLLRATYRWRFAGIAGWENTAEAAVRTASDLARDRGRQPVAEWLQRQDAGVAAEGAYGAALLIECHGNVGEALAQARRNVRRYRRELSEARPDETHPSQVAYLRKCAREWEVAVALLKAGWGISWAAAPVAA